MEELIKAFIEEFEGASEQLEKQRYKNAAILFSKALFALCDFIIYSKLKKLPKNHGERAQKFHLKFLAPQNFAKQNSDGFRVLEEYFSEIYFIVDNIFSHYTDAYSKPVLKETCTKIKDGIKEIIKNNELPEEIKKFAE